MRGEPLAVVWFQAAGCTGCSVSLMNAAYPDIKDLLLDEIVPGKSITLVFHATLMGPTGRPALEVLDRAPGKAAGDYLLVVEGAIPTRHPNFGRVGERPMAERAVELARGAVGVVAVGTCASYGGIPAGAPNPTGCVGIGELLRREGGAVPVVNVPGCPPHPRWFVETVAHLLLHGPPRPEELDGAGRLRAVYPDLVHDNCPRRADFDVGRFAPGFGDEGCLYELGCKGPYTDANCPYHGWNGGVNWCIKAGHPCIGCCEPEFPDYPSPLFRKATAQEAEASYRRSG
ncbi:MAG: hydrogenase small subunit [Caldiserica bacterium]|nr:hydrogenase small subunit [Caldisericota bacterium]